MVWTRTMQWVKFMLVRLGYYSEPNFLIIGTQKGGTSALHRYLSQSAYIKPGWVKEVNFFDQDNLYSRGKSWYLQHFPLPFRLGENLVTFEATPEYLYYPRCAERIFSFNPSIKLIALLRDPVDRAFSAWNMFRDEFEQYSTTSLIRKWKRYDQKSVNGLINMVSDTTFPDFEGVIQDEISKAGCSDAELEPSFVRRGLYYECLMRYFALFRQDQMLVLDNRLLKTDTLRILREITEFLELPCCDLHQASLVSSFSRPYVDQIPEKARALLQAFFAPHNEKLYQLLGHDFGWQ